jgi:MoxR-like ATPase
MVGTLPQSGLLQVLHRAGTRSRQDRRDREWLGRQPIANDAVDWAARLIWRVAANSSCRHLVTIAYAVRASAAYPAEAFVNPDAIPLRWFAHSWR